MSQPTTQTADERGRRIELTEAERHRLLAVKRRRVVLDVVSEELTSFGLRELATEVAAREEDADADDENDVEGIAVSLHHAHLPFMAELGAISYDSERKQMEPHDGLTAI